MSHDIVTNISGCYVDVPSLTYYSHIPTAVLSLLIGLYTYFKSGRKLAGAILLSITISFFIWSALSLITWFGHDSRLIMFAWSLFVMLDILIFALSLYFIYVFIDGKDIPSLKKALIILVVSPIIILAPTVLNLMSFNVDSCESQENILVKIGYLVEIIFAAWIIILCIYRYIKIKDATTRKKIILLAVGILFFLFAFSWANITASLTLDWNTSEYGFFGMPIFLAFLAYLIVRYKAFNIKLIATQALVAGLVILIGSEFFFIQNTTNIILTLITLLIALGFGYMLVKSVKIEVENKERLQSLSDQLSDANAKLRQLDKAKSEFISIASHQLRTPLTSIKGFGSLLLEGTYGVVPEAQRGALEKIYISNERLIQLVEDLLNISRIEAGRMEFDFQEAQIEDLVQEAVQTLELSAKAKNLYLQWGKPAIAMPKLKIDITKIKEVISNMVDNAIKYTQKGGITVKLETNTAWDTEHKEHKESVRVVVSDTGIGMDEEEIEMIFEKFQRGKQVAHYHTDGTGLGMYIGKKIVAEHKGKIWAESDGRGMGSRFILELPVS